MSEIDTATGTPPRASVNGKHDVITHRIVVSCIGATALLCGASITFLATLNKDTPAALTALGSAALGSLASMLVSIMRSRE
jgi:hypothetical protein